MCEMLSLRGRFSQIISSRLMCTKPTGAAATSAASNEPKTNSVAPKYKPSDLNKFLLVWTKTYKTKEEIPEYVPHEIIDRARSRSRIKIANILMALTVLASIGAIMSGKAAAKRGESIQKINEDFHKQYREDFDKKNPTQVVAK